MKKSNSPITMFILHIGLLLLSIERYSDLILLMEAPKMWFTSVIWNMK